MKTFYLIIIGLIILSFHGCGDCGSGKTTPTTKDTVIEKESFVVPPVPDSERIDQEGAVPYGKGRKKWNYPTPQPQPSPTSGIPCVYIHFDGGSMQHSDWNGGRSIALLNSGLTEEQKTQVVAVAQSYFALYNIIVTSDANIYNQSQTSVKTWVTQSAWYGDASYGGVTFTGSLYWNNDCPNFVFPSRLANHARYIGQLVAHEAGHALGLGHKYNQSGGLLSCIVMGQVLDCNPSLWGSDTTFLQQKLGLK